MTALAAVTDVFHIAPVPMWVYDAATLRFLAVNDAAVRRYGWSHDAFLSMSILDIRPDPDKARLRRFIGAGHVRMSGRTMSSVGTWVHRTRTGELIEVDVAACRAHHEGRDARLVMVHDVTERRRHADESAAQQARSAAAHAALEETLERITDGVLSVDRDRRLVTLNLRAAQLLGLDDGPALVGMPVDALWSSAATGRPGLASAIDEVSASQRHRVVQERIEATGRWLEQRLFPSATGVTVYLCDITESRVLRQTVERHESRFRALFEHSPDIMLLSRPDGTILDANPAACSALRMSAQQICAGGRAGIVDPSDPRLASLVARRASEGAVRGEVRMRRGDGTTFDAELTSATYVTADGSPCSNVTLRDISERQTAQAAIAASHSRLRDLTRTLLASERTLQQSVALALHDDIGQLLTVARLQADTVASHARRAGSATLGRSAEDLVATVARTIDSLRTVLVQLRPLLLEREGLLAALRDESALQTQALAPARVRLAIASAGVDDLRWPRDVEYAAFKVVREALVNAVRHGLARTVVIHVDGSPQRLALDVQDDGGGFDAASPRVHRADRLGLLGMHERAFGVGAEVTITSAPGQGSRVSFRWPAGDASAPPTAHGTPAG